MELAPSGVPLTFEVTFDRDDLFVGMSVYDNSGVNPVLVSGPAIMSSVVGNTYQGKFTAPLPRPYIIFKAVYTDEELTTLSEDYSQGSESIIAQSLPQPTSNSAGCSVVGIISNENDVIGQVRC